MQAYKEFPQEKARRLITKLQQLMSDQDKLSPFEYNRKYNNILNDLYPLLEFAAYNAINKKVQHLSNRALFFNSNIADGMNSVKDDLINYAISSILQYVPKIDVSRPRISDILWVIAKRSSQVYLYSTLIEPKYRFIQLDALDPETIDINFPSSESSILDYPDDESTYSVADVKSKLGEIYKKLYSDLKEKKISVQKFYKFQFINKLLFMYLFFEFDLSKDNVFFENVNAFTSNFRTTNNDQYLARVILILYSKYKTNYMYETKYTLKIGYKLVSEFLDKYIYDN